jgi:hypothetical protein
MANQEPLSDGNVTFLGGMDTSRSPVELSEYQYARAANLVIPRSLGGIKVRPGFGFQFLKFDSLASKETFETGQIQAEGWFRNGADAYLVVVVDGLAFRFSRLTASAWEGEALNKNDLNDQSIRDCWISRIPDGVIVNNGKNNPLVIKATTSRRTDPSKGEIGPGRAGVYVQNRFYYISSSGLSIRFSDFLNPLGETEGKLAGVDKFVAPENQDEIIAIGRQKVMLDYVTGGALLFSTRINIYSIDVRGDVPSWRVLNTRVGKVTESITELSACSPYAFEPFGGNVYFRSPQFGICDLRQSQYQFNQFDSTTTQSVEASYFLDNDTDWMLSKCYMRAWKSRLLTTVAPEQNDKGYIFWNGILSSHPDHSAQGREAVPRRFESVFTGVRPVAMTCLKMSGRHDELFIWSYDKDGINRLYAADDRIDYDTNHRGQKIEIEGWLELRAYNFQSKVAFKESQATFYHTYAMPRDVSICFYGRTQSSGQWELIARRNHLIDSIKMTAGHFEPENIHSQVRGPVNLPNENQFKCNSKTYLYIQDRLEFKGPIHLDSFIRVANVKVPERNMPPEEKRTRLVYTYRPDYGYSISQSTP